MKDCVKYRVLRRESERCWLFGYQWVCPADLSSKAVESGREVCRVRKSPAYRRIDGEVFVERSGDRG